MPVADLHLLLCVHLTYILAAVAGAMRELKCKRIFRNMTVNQFKCLYGNLVVCNLAPIRQRGRLLRASQELACHLAAKFIISLIYLTNMGYLRGGIVYFYMLVYIWRKLSLFADTQSDGPQIQKYFIFVWYYRVTEAIMFLYS